MISSLLPPLWLIHVAVAAVWFYEGVWCKLLNGQPRQVRVIEAMPRYGARIGKELLKLLGFFEAALGVWILTGIAPDCLRSRANFAACNPKRLRTPMGAAVN